MTSPLPRASVFVPGKLPVSHRKAHRLLAFIDRFRSEHGYAPSLAECAGGAGYSSKSGVHGALVWLRGMGLVTYDPVLARSVKVVQP